MNLYFATENEYLGGLYILAENRGKAKVLFMYATGEAFTDIRVQTIKKDVGEYKAGAVYYEDKTTLDSLGVKYADFYIENYI